MWIDARGSTVLPLPECKRLLAVAAKGHRVGRLGAPTAGAPLVVPVNFDLHDGAVVVRVSNGTILRAAAGHLVAFEVDALDEGVAWSVLVRGLATLIESPSREQLAGTTSFVPEPGSMLLVIRPDRVTGRRFGVRAARHPDRAVS